MIHQRSRFVAQPDADGLKIVPPGEEASPPEALQKVHVLRRWCEYDSNVANQGIQQRANWDVIFGVALIVGISVGFWIGVGFLVVHLLR